MSQGKGAKGTDKRKRAKGSGQGCAQQHRRDRVRQGENIGHSAEEPFGDSMAKIKTAASFTRRKVDRDVG